MENKFLLLISTILSIESVLNTHVTTPETLEYEGTSLESLANRFARRIDHQQEVLVQLNYDYETYNSLGLLYVSNKNNSKKRYIISDQMVEKEDIINLCVAHGFSSGSLTTMGAYIIDVNIYTYLKINSCRLLDTSNKKSLFFKLVCEKNSKEEIEKPAFVFCTKHPYYFDSSFYLGLEHLGKKYFVCHIKSNAYDFCKSFGALNRNFNFEFDQVGFPSTNQYANIVCSKHQTEKIIMIDDVCGFTLLEKDCDQEIHKINCQKKETAFESSLNNADLFYLPDNLVQLKLRVNMQEKRLIKITYVDFSNYCRGLSFTFKRNCLLYHEEKNKNIVTMFLLCKEFLVKFNKVCLTFSNSDMINILSYKSSLIVPITFRNMVVSRRNFQYKISPPFLLQQFNEPSNMSENVSNLKETFSIVPKMSFVKFAFHWSYKPFLSETKTPLFKVENFVVKYQTSLPQFSIDPNNLNLFMYLPLQNGAPDSSVAGTYKLHQRLEGLRDDHIESSWKINVIEVWDKPVCNIRLETRRRLVASCALKYFGKLLPKVQFKVSTRVRSREITKSMYRNAVSYDYIVGFDHHSKTMFEFYKKRAAEMKLGKRFESTFQDDETNRDFDGNKTKNTNRISRSDGYIYCMMFYDTPPYTYEETVKCDIGLDSFGILSMLDREATRWSAMFIILGISFFFLIVASIVYVKKISPQKKKRFQLVGKPEKVKKFSSIKQLDGDDL